MEIRLWPALLALLCTQIHAQFVLLEDEIPSELRGSQIGYGYNTLTGEITKYKCYEVAGLPKATSEATAAVDKIFARIGSSFEELFESRSNSVRATVGYQGFKGSASHSAMSSSKISAYNDFAQIYSTTRFERRTGDASASKPIVPENSADHYDKCGDAYIIGEVSGHFFLGTIFTTAKTREDIFEARSALRASMRAIGTKASVDANATEIKQLRSASRLFVTTLESSKGLGLQNSIEGLIDAAEKYSNWGGREPVIIAYVIHRPKALSFSAEGPEEFTEEAKTVRALYQRHSNLQFIISNSQLFYFGASTYDLVKSEMQLLQEEISRRSRDMQKCLAEQVSLTKRLSVAPVGKEPAALFDNGLGPECKEAVVKLQRSTKIIVRGAIEPAAYVDLTRSMLRREQRFEGDRFVVLNPDVSDNPTVVTVQGTYYLSSRPRFDDVYEYPVVGGRGCQHFAGSPRCLGTRFGLQAMGGTCPASRIVFQDKGSFTVPGLTALTFWVEDVPGNFHDNVPANESPDLPKLRLARPIYIQDTPPPLNKDSMAPDSLADQSALHKGCRLNLNAKTYKTCGQLGVDERLEVSAFPNFKAIADLAGVNTSRQDSNRLASCGKKTLEPALTAIGATDSSRRVMGRPAGALMN